MTVTNPFMLMVAGGLVFLSLCVGAFWWRRKRKQPKGELWAIIHYSNGKDDQTWPFPFQTTQQVESWWDQNWQKIEGVSEIEVTRTPARSFLW